MASSTTPIPPMRADWTASGACTSGSTAPPRGVTRRASGGAATTSTTRAERSRGCRGATAGLVRHPRPPWVGAGPRRPGPASARPHRGHRVTLPGEPFQALPDSRRPRPLGQPSAPLTQPLTMFLPREHHHRGHGIPRGALQSPARVARRGVALRFPHALWSAAATVPLWRSAAKSGRKLRLRTPRLIARRVNAVGLWSTPEPCRTPQRCRLSRSSFDYEVRHLDDDVVSPRLQAPSNAARRLFEAGGRQGGGDEA